jgi:hypothetical protein
MFTSLLLTASLAGGQPPVAIPSPLPGVMVVGQPATLPAVPVVQEPKKDVPGGVPNVDEIPTKSDPEADAPRTKYFLERSIAETRLGKILDQNGIIIQGWTQGSYNASSAANSNAPVYMIDKANSFVLNQNYLHIEKTLDTSKKEFQLGFVTDWILPGSDARTTVERGLWFDQVTNGTQYPIDPFQFYAQAYLPGIGDGTTVKVGRFATHVGYELVQAVDTPFVSRSYMFQYNPFTHTGVYATTTLGDNWTVGYGASTGSETFIDAPTNKATFLGQLKWAPKEGKTSVAFNVVITDPSYNAAQNFQLYNFYNLVLTHKFTDKLTYVLDTGYSHMNDYPTGSGADTGTVDWYGAANYLIYSHTDTLTSTLRAEVFNDQQGARTGFAGLYTEATYGLAWKAMDGLIIRPSIRYDNNSKTQVWEGKQNLFTATMDVIIRW